ncbi:MAG: histidine--tRNA ligase [Gammaproteobacteria bacterium]|nr:histidine--tRNA ligase [Gammaproteobacteria bacterium]NNC96871.1 histidine--tRNA ligase [Gammaproteobacteria bacterium]NNM13016.1 histidine--tRNA ligase [Gammaproteobacteria bacterium]
MSKIIQSLRGMNDILPNETPHWQFLENTVREILSSYAYREIRFPVVEHTELFKRSIGEVTDIVEKEMYSFGGDDHKKYSLRPEGTAGCVRAGISNGLLYNQTQKLWYMGPMFRHEKPQEGRYRQFHQIGAEAFGFAGPEVDAELIMLTARLWKKLGLSPMLEINSIGSSETRVQYRTALVGYFTSHRDLLDEDSLRRLERNPMRILDSKIPQTQELVKNAPVLSAFLNQEEQDHFLGLQNLLDDAGITYRVNPRLVRGLDYYSLTVFEWITDQLGAQNAICSGGRYDGLVEQLGGKPCKAVGWAMGIERVVLLLKQANIQIPDTHPELYLVLDAAAEVKRAGFQLAEKIRDGLNGVKLEVYCGHAGFKSQLKQADKSGAQFALILGQDELAKNCISLKNLRVRSEQESLAFNDIISELCKRLESQS